MLHDLALARTRTGDLPCYAGKARVTQCSMQGQCIDVDCWPSVRLRREGRIVGGETATKGEFPWLVSLTKNGGHFCGGTLVNKHWVLTAAHCLCSGTDTLGTTGLRVTLSQHNLLQGGDLRLPVTKVILHPDFRCASYDSDLALLRLGAAAPWSSGVLPACFSDPTAEEATVAGWGWTEENSSKGKRANVLRKVRLSIVDNMLCQEWYLSQGKALRVQDSQLCAGVEAGGKDACWADSGGPLMVGEEGEMAVVGVVSTGVGCARPRLPGLYTRVATFLKWMNSTMVENS
ncbi:trypsin-1-like [Macrosteles quadrilineatus]|uniref:trypsin-1-like n=1 Tax=Macrosteles quadrilineatus TaxID=74068 RepID=UPI0023E2924F|nr:trypsin-1-like [Macrosteles quadrilineatus]